MKYTTIQGDMWDSIAYKFYRSCACMDKLINANPDYRHVFLFSAGVELNIPGLQEGELPDDLPPWKQVEG